MNFKIISSCLVHTGPADFKNHILSQETPDALILDALETCRCHLQLFSFEKLLTLSYSNPSEAKHFAAHMQISNQTCCLISYPPQYRINRLQGSFLRNTPKYHKQYIWRPLTTTFGDHLLSYISQKVHAPKVSHHYSYAKKGEAQTLRQTVHFSH